MSFKDNSYLERQISEELDKSSSLRDKISNEYSSLVTLLDDFKEYRALETDLSFEDVQEQKKVSLIELESTKSSDAKGSSKISSIKPQARPRKLAYFSNRNLKSNEIQVMVNLFYPSNTEIFDILTSKKGTSAKNDSASVTI